LSGLPVELFGGTPSVFDAEPGTFSDVISQKYGMVVVGGIGVSFFPNPAGESSPGAPRDNCQQLPCFLTELLSPTENEFNQFTDDCVKEKFGGKTAPLDFAEGSGGCGGDLSGAEAYLIGNVQEKFTDPSPIKGKIIYGLSNAPDPKK